MLTRIIPIICHIVVMCAVGASSEELSIVWNESDKAFEVIPAQTENFISHAYFRNEINVTG
jgi:hypothetical protein